MWKRQVLRLVVVSSVFACGVPRESVSAENDSPKALLKTFASEFVEITPGEAKFPATFKMGSADNPSEQPVRDITLKHKFAMARYEVTQDLYQVVMGSNPSKWKGPRNSVEMMSWEDANEFCRRVTASLREQKLISETELIRLPTEAEWEYCCRAGTTMRYSFGDVAQTPGVEEFDVLLIKSGENKAGMIKLVCGATGLGLKEAKELVETAPKPLKQFLSEEGAAKLLAEIEEAGGAGKARPAILLDRYGWHTGNAALNDPPVGALKPNPWGLYDMHGYLWEFTADGWSADYSQAPVDGTSVPVKDMIVIRSGSWKDKSDQLTSATRRRYSIKAGDDAVGFRCVKAAAP